MGCDVVESVKPPMKRKSGSSIHAASSKKRKNNSCAANGPDIHTDSMTRRRSSLKAGHSETRELKDIDHSTRDQNLGSSPRDSSKQKVSKNLENNRSSGRASFKSQISPKLNEQVTHSSKKKTPKGRSPASERNVDTTMGGLIKQIRAHLEAEDVVENDNEVIELIRAVQEARNADDQYVSDDDDDASPVPEKPVRQDPMNHLDDLHTKRSGQSARTRNTPKSSCVDRRSIKLRAKGLDKPHVNASRKDHKKAKRLNKCEAVDEAATHLKDLDFLKESDPSFYQFLKENSAELLEFEPGSNDLNRQFVHDDNVDLDYEIGEHSEHSNDEDAEDERAAAEEAGLDLQPSRQLDCNTPDVKGKRSAPHGKQIVDMTMVRELHQKLSSTRGSVKAVKELMRLFRAGRQLTTVAQEKSKTKAEKSLAKHRRNKEKIETDWYDVAGEDKIVDSSDDDDKVDNEDVVAAGEVKFASAHVYQKVMYLAIVSVQEALDKILHKPQPERASLLARWVPHEQQRWKNIEPIFKSYVAQVVSLASSMQDAPTLRFMLKRMELLVPYTRGNLRLARKLTRLAINVWTSDTVNVNEATKLRAYLLLRHIADEPDNTEIVLRLVVKTYCGKVSRICNPRTIPNILFTAKCIVDLFGVDMAASYSVAFSYLREMAVTLRTVLTSKGGAEQSEKVHNWSFVNALRLWAMVLSAYEAEEELRPLVYPYVQISIAVIRIQATPRTFPMRLHICSFLTQIVRGTGIYIPIAAQLLPILRCKEFCKKPDRGSSKEMEWRSLLRAKDESVKTKPFLTGVLNWMALELAGFFAALSRHVSFPELSLSTAQALRHFSKATKEEEWRQVTHTLAVKLIENAKLVANARARASFGPHGTAVKRGMLEPVPGLEDLHAKTPVERFYDVELARSRRQEAARDANAADKELSKQTGGSEDDFDSDTAESEEDDEKTATTEIGRTQLAKGRKNSVEKPTSGRHPLFRVEGRTPGDDDEDTDGDLVEDLVLSSDEE